MGKESLGALVTRLTERTTISEMTAHGLPETEVAERNTQGARAAGWKEGRNTVPRQTRAMAHTIVQPKSGTRTNRRQSS